ncbi:MAG: hypothetical protein AAGG68_12690 [Bacteroidota bacterium]
MKQFSIIAGLAFLIMISCNSSEAPEFSETLWLNGYYDESFLFSYPELRDYEGRDSFLVHDLRADTQIISIPYSFTDSTFIRDTTSFQLLENGRNRRVVKYEEEEGKNRVSCAVQKVNLNYPDAEAVKDFLMRQSLEKNYQLENESFSFNEVWTFETDKIVKTTSYLLDRQLLYAEKEYYCWKVTQYDKYFFLTWYGHKDDCDSPLGVSEQILQLDNKQLSLSNCLGAKWSKEIFSATTQPDFPSKDYKVCHHHINEYYYRATDNGRRVYYDGGLRAILAEAKSKYVVPKNAAGQTGWIRIRFVINCEGQLGRFRIQEIDSEAQLTQFNPEITTQLFKIVQELEGYHPRLEEENRTLDDYKHITFKLKDGEIIEILP